MVSLRKLINRSDFRKQFLQFQCTFGFWYHILSSITSLPRYLNLRTCLILTSTIRSSHPGLFILLTIIHSVFIQWIDCPFFPLSFTTFFFLSRRSCSFCFCICYQHCAICVSYIKQICGYVWSTKSRMAMFFFKKITQMNLFEDGKSND